MASSNVNKKVAVIGAGPAGLAAAYRLAQGGCSVDLFEAGSEVGGMSRSLTLWGHIVDLGPHRFFSGNEEVNKFWFQAIGDEFCWVKRQTRIFYKGRYFNYPLQAWNTFINLGPKESILSLLSYCRQKLTWKRWARPVDDNFAAWVISRFGQRLFQIFFKTYSEKLWGLPCEQIDADFAYRKIRSLSFFEIIKKFLNPKKTYVEYFAYPHRGTGSVYHKLQDRFEKMNGRVFLNTPITDLKYSESSVALTSPRGTQVYDTVISTMPLTHLVRMLEAPHDVQQASRDLKFRNTILVFLLVEGYDHFSDNWIYVHSPYVDFGRVTNFRNWSPQLYGESTDTVLCLEYWCNDDESLWQLNDSELIAKAKEELVRSGLIKGARIFEGSVCRVPKSYPVFKIGYKKNLEVIKKHLSNYERLCTIGRYGAFKYNNQDHSLLMGLKAAEGILNGYRGDLSSINAQAIYEEDFAITDQVLSEFEEI